MLILGNGTVFTRDENKPMIDHGAIAMEDGKIVAVGKTDVIRATYPKASFVDAEGKIIHPGFINAHHHIYSALARGLGLPNYNPSNFLEILEGMWFYLDSKLTKESVWASAALTYMSCIQNGVTSIIDHHASYGEIDDSLSVIAKEAKRYGVRSVLCYEVSDRHGKDAMEAAVAENLRFAEEAKEDPSFFGAMMGLHASFTLSEETLAYVVSQNTNNLGYHVHVAEDESDENDSQEKYGMRVVERFHEAGILGEKSLCGHCLHVNEKEISLLAQTKTPVVYCAESNMGNSVGLPQTVSLYEAGVPIMMGTDGYTSDMLESYKVANCAAKYKYGPSAGWVENATALMTNNGTLLSSHLSTTVGVLKEGAAADVIVIDYNPPTPLSAANIDGHLLFGANGLNVVTTISDGVVRMHNRKFVNVDQHEEMEKIRHISTEFWHKLGV